MAAALSKASDQAYLYFVVAQDGTWLIKSREGSATPTVREDAQRRGEETGRQRPVHQCPRSARRRRQIDFVVNGTVVHTEAKTGPLAKTDGIYGIRINHLLEVDVDGFGVTK